MSTFGILVLACATAFASWWLTGHVRRYALARHIVDVPNSRSLHAQPTPRGGGLAIVLATVAGISILGLVRVLPWRDVYSLCGAGGLVAAVGFADDHGFLSRVSRLAAHFAAAAAVIGWIGGLPPIPLISQSLDLGWAGVAIGTLYVVWLVNLTNFMDGIDGIAGLEALTVSLGGVLLYTVGTPVAMDWSVPLVVAAAAAGFLIWNWPPAQIFMGDVGSGFLGLMLAALSLRAADSNPNLIWSWLILLGVFIVDATLTLARRVVRGERVYEPHRMHAYQHAALRRGRHKPVTVAVGLINFAWLLPIALLVASGVLHGPIGLVAAYVPLMYTAWRLGAGTSEPGRSMDEAIV